MRTQRGSMQSAGVTTLSILSSALLLATSLESLPAARGDEPPIDVQSTFVCSSSQRQLHIAANSSWQAVTMQALNQNFTGDCSLHINISTYVDGSPSLATPSQPQQHQMPPMLLLLKIDQVKLAPPNNGTCDDAINSLNVFTQNRSRNTGYMCNFSSVYLWTNESIEFYMYAKTIYDSAPSFSAAFVVTAEFINVCDSAFSSVERQVERELYVFASDSRYSKIFEKYLACSSTNYTMSFAASNLTGGLSLVVLASPPSSSCCSLFLDEQRCADGCTHSFGPSSRYTLQYSCDCCSDDNNPSFILRVSVVSTAMTQTSTTSEGPTATLASTSSSKSDTTSRDAATHISTQPSGNRPLNSAVPSVSGSSSLSSTLLTTLATNAEPGSSTYRPPELISVSSSPEVFGNEKNGAAPDVSTVVAAVVGSVVGVSIVVTVSAIFTKRRYHLKCAKAAALQESSDFRQSGTTSLSQLSPPLVSNSLLYKVAQHKSATDIQVAMIDNDLYAAMK